MSKTRFTYPIGKPIGNSFPAFTQHLKSVITANENDFGPDHISAEFTFSPDATIADETILAIWGGKYTIANGIITSEPYPDTYVELLREVYGENLPVPRKVIYGPVDISDRIIELNAGDEIGKLSGDVFFIRFVDKNDFYINANTCLELFNNRNFFYGELNSIFPFSRINLSDNIELLFNEKINDSNISIKIYGGSFSRTIYNPPTIIPSEIFSFLSKDSIQIDVLNAPANNIKIEIKDISDPACRTLATNPIVKNQTSFTFIPQEHLKPNHAYFAKENGKLIKDQPLQYSIKIFSAAQLICEAKIMQDLKDTIRQEYLFHSRPFQPSGQINIPTRSEFFRNNLASHYFDVSVFNAHNNYGDLSDPIMLNVEENIQVAEFIRWHFANELRILVEMGFPGAEQKLYTNDLKITSSWRNPERNETVGGVLNSNHQYGKALDMRSVHCLSLAAGNPNNVPLHYALFQAAWVFLNSLITLNGATHCRNVEMLMERNAEKFLSFSIDTSGNIKLNKLDKYSSINPPPTTDNAGIISSAAKYASHIHIGWKSDTDDPLKLPDVPEYEIESSILPFKNVILMASEDASVDDSDQLPLPHVASTIKEYLDNSDSGIETVIIHVANPLDMLEVMGVSGTPFMINYFFFMGHAYEHGLILTHTNVPIVNPELEMKLNQLYGKEIKIGSDDQFEFRLNQFRVSNLRLLPEELIYKIRERFKDVKEIFILGCNAGNSQKSPHENTFCQELASLVNRPVYGAAYYSKVFKRNETAWDEVDITRSAPYTSGSQFVLAPNSLGGTQFAFYFRNFGYPYNYHPSQSSELFAFYKESLQLSYPNPNFDYQRMMSVDNLETIDD